MHLPLARLVSMPVIFCLLPSSRIVLFLYFTYFLQPLVNSMCENCDCECNTVNTVHWFDTSCSVIPVNISITLISPVQSLAGLHFFAADSRPICVALQISEQYSPKARTPAHWMPSTDQILTQNDHSRSSVSASMKSH